ncbi:hypothetical protein HanRHA438_Chr04g0159771 [Helianthus annuus]|nr:hypothetical protein HanRHA438_Chr04g0159771 [Helianthus annuus]
MVGLQIRELGLNLLDPRLVFFKKHRAAAVVKGGPHRAIVSESKNQEITR